MDRRSRRFIHSSATVELAAPATGLDRFTTTGRSLSARKPVYTVPKLPSPTVQSAQSRNPSQQGGRK